jgi:hypothetical protein
METTAARGEGQRRWALAASSSGQWCNMERASGERKDVDTVSVARLSCFNGRRSADDYRRVNGHNWLLLEQFRYWRAQHNNHR